MFAVLPRVKKRGQGQRPALLTCNVDEGEDGKSANPTTKLTVPNGGTASDLEVDVLGLSLNVVGIIGVCSDRSCK